MDILHTILRLAVVTVLAASLLEALVLTALRGFPGYDWRAAGISVVALLEIEFGQWAALWRDLRSARSVGEAWGYRARPPGWRPDGQGATTEDLRRQAGLPPGAALSPPALPAGPAPANPA